MKSFTRMRLEWLCALAGLTLAPLAGMAVDTGLLPADSAPMAPACALSTADATPAQDGLEQFRGQVLYLDFWASWCGPCRQSFPFMNDLQARLGPRGLRVVAVNLDEQAADAAAFLAAHPADFGIATSPEQACATAFGVEAMPSSYLIDRAGRVRYVHHGFRGSDVERLRPLVETLIEETAPASPAPHANTP